jgi:hypothetical protein
MSSTYSFRIKTDASATNSAVKNVTYNVSGFFMMMIVDWILVGQFCIQLYPLWRSDHPGTRVLLRSPVADYITYLQSYPSDLGTPGNGVTISVCVFSVLRRRGFHRTVSGYQIRPWHHLFDGQQRCLHGCSELWKWNVHRYTSYNFPQ